MIKNIIIGVLAVTLLAALCVAAWFIWDASDLKAENRTLSLSLQACDARNANIIEDIQRDAIVSDPGFTVPGHWLRPIPEAGADSQQ